MGGPARWDEADQAKAVAYERWLAEACGNCHTRKSDWFDDEGWPLLEPVWEIAVEQCEGCITMARAQRAAEGVDHAYSRWKPFGTVLTHPGEED